MKRVIGFVTARWFVTLIGAIALALLFWFLGPLIAIAEVRPLESEIARMIVVMAILVGWGLLNLFSRVKDKRTNEKMIETIAVGADGKTGGDASESAEEIALLKTRLDEALALLRKSAGGKGKRYLYQLPWYMIIGPPGSGKTTALANSGLKFPLAEKYGKDPVKGVGGTRNCDWWFTDEAVLLDTAGRYTTQDSHQTVDQAAWRGFLGLLKKFRPRQPVNGALVAISLSDVALMPQADRMAHARSIRQRLKELQDEFGVRFPVYVLFTKADLVAGFVEFFDNLGREEREQVWGTTFAMDDGKEGAAIITQFPAEFDGLVQRLNDQLLDRVQQETDLGKRTLVYGFPAQVASLKQPLQEFLDEIFMPNRYEGRPLLRGVYLTSGTQEGTPIDRMMGAMAATFGIDRQRLSSFSGAGRGYFLTRLLRNVVFAEASIVSADPKVELRQTWLRRGAYAAAALAVLALGGLWTASYLNNEALIARIESGATAYEKQATPVATPVVADADLEGVLPALRTARTLPAGFAAKDESVPTLMGFGLYQGDKLGSQEIALYRRGLGSVFLPRLLVRLGQQIGGNVSRPDYVHEALKAYLMLGSQGPLDKDFVRQWMQLDWSAAFPGPAKEPVRRELAEHLETLLSTPLPEIALDGRVVEQARRALLQSPVASRAYNSIRQSAAARQMPEWRIADHFGAAGDRVFQRNSGKPFAEGVPGFYTYDGFYKVLLPSIATVARDMARESWVLGSAPATGGEDRLTTSLERDIAQLYATDYIRLWDALLADVAMVPFRSAQHATEVVNVISAPTSPLKMLYTDIAKETKLGRVPEVPALPGAAGQAVKAAADAAQGAANKLSGVLGQAGIQAPNYGEPVDQRYAPLHKFVGLGATGPAPIDDLIKNLNDLYNALAAPPGPQKAAAMTAAVQRIKNDAPRQPAPLGPMSSQIANNAVRIQGGDAKTAILEAWKAQVLPFCVQALENRYPLVRTSQVDVTIDDFTRLFAPGGMIDNFFNGNLKPYVDTAASPWRMQKVDDVEVSIANDVLMQFQRAATIRDLLFAGGKPGMKVQVTPVSLDASATAVLLEVGGQSVTYNHGPPRPAQLEWPGQLTAEGRLAFQPAQAGQSTSITKNGPWSLFRLFDEAKIEQGQFTDKARMTFTVGGRKVTYDLQANSVINPLTMKELGEFRCPKSF